ncbi:MAG: hypothetical protein FWH15_06650 [Betaproteobacteria bacterium]|nr:hypothetical protein [Betaproteobacteria bacterium]
MSHMRSILWVKDDDPRSAINQGMAQGNKTGAQKRWQAYNRQNGQYMSLQEAVVPEQFWVDKSQCRYIDGEGQIQNPALAGCAQAISAVRALAIAQQQGQKIYTLTRENAATALPTLPIGGALGQEIRSAVQAGKEVTIHEKPITAHGWTGYGYTIIDPDTGAGGYIIEGSGNGAELLTPTEFYFGWLIVPILIGIAIALIWASGLAAMWIAILIGLELINYFLWLRSVSQAQTEHEFIKASASAAAGALLGMFPAGGEVPIAECVKWLGIMFAQLLSMI